MAYYEPTLLKDINPGTGSMGGSSNRVSMGDGRIFFEANDGTHGYELWVSNGTAAGTFMVKDLDTDNNALEITDLTNVNGTLFFTDKIGTNYYLYKSDGTEAGTTMVKDLGTSYDNSAPAFALGSLFFFVYNDGTNGSELWKSDGTGTGTTIVKDIYSGSESGVSVTTIGLVVNGNLYFTATDGTNGVELWKTDGTSANTSMVKDINSSGTSSPSDFTNVDNFLFFTADDGTNGKEVWVSDGSGTGTEIVKDLASGITSSNPSQLIAYKNELYFWTQIGATYSLYKSDGTSSGTIKVTDVVAKPKSHSGLYSVAVAGDYLFFSMDDASTYGEELWKTDGTAAGTAMVKDIYPGADDSESMNLTAFNNTLYFQANDAATYNYELWQSDGTEAGTFMTKDISLNASYPDSDPTNFVVSGNFLYFQAWVYQGTDTEWYIIDITPASTPTPTPAQSSPSSSGSVDTSPHACNDPKPLGTPDLFQINVTGTSAKLFFTPLADTKHYYISFSTKTHAEEHGEEITLGNSGVQTETIYYLRPNTTYYFKIRGQNGCTPGDWGKIIKATTGGSVSATVTHFYKNSPSGNKSSSPSSPSTLKEIETELVPTLAPTTLPKKATEVVSATPPATPSLTFFQKILRFFHLY